MVDGCNMDDASMNLIYAVQSRNQESQGSLAVVVNWTFTPGSVDLHTSFFTNHRRVILFFACEIFVVVLNHKIILTAKFSRSTCSTKCGT